MIGELATSKTGHDKGRLYLIVKEDDENVYLCDGRLRSVNNLKKKKKKHIQIIHFSAPGNLLQGIETMAPEWEDVINEQIRKLLGDYLNR